MPPETHTPAPAIPAIPAIPPSQNSRNSGNSGVAGPHFSDAAAIFTVRPGPALYVWQGGQQLVAAPLTPTAALCLAADLLRAVQALNLKETP